MITLHVVQLYIYIYIWGARARIICIGPLNLGPRSAWVSKANPEDWSGSKPCWDKPSPTIRMLGLRNYHSRESYGVWPTTDWWDGGKSTIKWLNSGWFPRIVSAFGEFVAERHLAFGTSFKRILRRHDCFLGFWVKVELHGNWWKVMIWTPLRKNYIRGVRADNWGDWKNWGKKGEKEKTESESEKGRSTIRGEGGVVQKLAVIIEIGMSKLYLKATPVGLLGNPLINKLGT